jgi:hypothetical protein
MIRTAGFLLWVAAGTAGAAQPAVQPIGRLFFTPAERAQLDVARANKRVAEPPAGKSAEPPRPETQIITYNGIVRRSDGKATLWLNSRAADEKEALSGLPVSGRVRPDGGVTLQVPNSGGTIDLRVGQRAELQTGRVSEARPPEKDAAKSDPKVGDSSKSDAAKGDAAKGEGARPEAAKGEAPKSDAAKSDPKAPAPSGKAPEPAERRTEPSATAAAKK